MRTHILLALVLTTPFAMRGQFIEMADQHSYDVSYSRIVPVSGGFAVEAWSHYDGPDVPGLGGHVRFIDPAGQLSLAQQVSLINGSNNGSVIYTSRDGGLWCFGRFFGGDVIGSAQLMRFNGAGDILMERNWDEEAWVFADRMAKEPTEHLALLGESDVYITDTLGDVVDQWASPPGAVGPSLWSNDSTLVLSSGEHLVLTRMNGDILAEANIGSEVLDIRSFNGGSLLLCEDSIHLFSAALVKLSSAEFIASDGRRAFLEGTAEVLFQAGGRLFRWQTPTSIELLLEPELLPGQTINGMVLLDTLLSTVSTIHTFDHGSGLYKTYGLSSATTQHSIDVAVTEMLVDSIWTTCLQSSTPGYAFCSTWANTTVTVTNVGDEVLDEVVLGHKGETWYPWPTYPNGSMLRLTDLGLASGESTTVQMMEMIIRASSSQQGQVYEADICITALSPNELVDRDPEDNRNCTTASVLLPVGLTAQSTFDQLSISPNPFTDRIILRNIPSDATAFELFDATGRCVFQANGIAMNGSLNIDVPGLLPGLYHGTITARSGLKSLPLVRADP
ncbi:MAG: T9SS type A sorting domain-containing protein [Flavobacteriales bacterium]|nr:T9SS type A sorting domain-containing protein [Flavobacteriales bacterium]